MGLDMYLTKKHYIGNQYRKEEQQVKVIIPDDQSDCTFPTGKIKQNKISYIIEDVAYWRKANFIHRWFVDNVQYGEDDCGSYELGNEKLKELVNLCKETIILLENTPKVKMTIEGSEEEIEVFDVDNNDIKLPTQSGFFFGSTYYDDWYMRDLKKTVEQLEPLLDDDTADYEYSSSW